MSYLSMLRSLRALGIVFTLIIILLFLYLHSRSSVLNFSGDKNVGGSSTEPKIDDGGLTKHFIDLNLATSSSTTEAQGSLNPFRDAGNETLGFQKIFVINLPSRTDHRDSMTLAAHFTGLQVEFVDGVTGVVDKAVPLHDKELELRPGDLGAWRAHVNVARMIVEQNITSALVLEDDADWDLRIKSQMPAFAKASRSLLHDDLENEVGSRAKANGHLYGPSWPGNSTIVNTSEKPLKLTSSPYGDADHWGVFWLGHCGTHFPTQEDDNVSRDRAALFNDETVPEPQHVNIQFGDDRLTKQYPPHTRVVHHVASNICTLGYAMSLQGARHVLYELGMERITGAFDVMLQQLCQGSGGRRKSTCLTVQPQLFQHHRPAGPRSSESDISNHGGHNPTPYSRNIRWSTQINIPKLLDGDTNYTDTYPDGAKARDYGYR